MGCLHRRTGRRLQLLRSHCIHRTLQRLQPLLRLVARGALLVEVELELRLLPHRPAWNRAQGVCGGR